MDDQEVSDKEVVLYTTKSVSVLLLQSEVTSQFCVIQNSFRDNAKLMCFFTVTVEARLLVCTVTNESWNFQLRYS